MIGDAEPQGLCGSGLVDAVTGLVKVGLLDSSGRFVPEEQAAALAPGLADRLTMIGKERVFVLHWRGARREDSIYLSQRDVRELQFAKAAIATGWQILLEEAGLTAADVKQVLLAGSFGSYLSAGQRDQDRPGAEGARDARGVARATWPARGRRWRCSACVSGPAAWRCSRR